MAQSPILQTAMPRCACEHHTHGSWPMPAELEQHAGQQLVPVLCMSAPTVRQLGSERLVWSKPEHLPTHGND